MIDLGERICDFMLRRGGAYATISPELEYNIYHSLGTGNYVVGQDSGGQITYFACFWRIRPEDVENVKRRIKPADVTTGSVMYVAEAASSVGMRAVIEALREKGVGMKGVFWHRPARKDRVFHSPSQGGSDGITERE